MGETGKRGRSDNDGKNQRKRTNNNENSGDMVIYRIICPDSVIGSVIGKSGKVINSLRQETHSKIKVVERFPGTSNRVILIYCQVKDSDIKDYDLTEDDEDHIEPLCPAQDGLLRVHAEIVNALNNDDDSEKKLKEEVEILVPKSQAANIIGKQGSTIKKLRAKTNANIKVNSKDPSNPAHNCAMSFDNFVTITGDADAVKKALFAVSGIMYKFPPKEEISLDTDVPQTTPTIIIPSDYPIYPTSSTYPGLDPTIPFHSSVPPLATPNVPEFSGLTDIPGAWPAYPSASAAVSSRSEELKVRVLCPSYKIGRVIGKGGSAIKSIRQNSGAHVEVDDKKDASEECLITVISTESTHDLKSAAVEAVLLLQEKISDEDDETINIRLLVPSKVIGCIIGKSGSIINEMRKSTKADIRISKGEKPKLASSSDEFVEVSGEVGSVRNALLQIILRLREDVLRDRDGGQNAPSAEPLFSGSFSVPPPVQSVPPVAPMSYERAESATGFGMLTGSSLYGYSSLQAGENGYGALSSYPSSTYGGFSITEVLIPSHAVGKVIGKSGANLANIRKISGATVEVVDSKTSRSERIAQISGTPDQKRTAENLIQAFIMAT